VNSIKTATIINIRPESSVYATYQRLSYKPWYAIAEFVDNSTQNYYDHKKELLISYKKEPKRPKMHVEISYDGDKNSLLISDNANGMEIDELTRAVALDKPPLNKDGRCEYGMGLKTAACWFGRTWTITTSRLGSIRELTAKIHVPDLVATHAEKIIVSERKVKPSSHYTKIIIEGLYKPIRGRTVGRIYEQLGSMYRQDLRSGQIEIIWNGTPIAFNEPPILKENLGGKDETTWKKNILLEVPWEAEGITLNATGWIGIRMPGSQKDAGFALFRRGRVIIGGPGDGYKPIDVFGQANSFRSQRLIGELDMDRWPVTQAKDAFDWSGGLEDVFIEKLKEASKDYGDKCEGLRERNKRITITDMQLASESTQQVISDVRFGQVVEQEITLPEPPKTEQQEKADVDKLSIISEGPIIYQMKVRGEEWIFHLYWQDQLSDAHWMSVNYPDDTLTNIFLNMAHPFFLPYLNIKGSLELIQKFVISLALAERMARKIHGESLVAPDDFRNFMNKVLRYASEIEENHDA
jgi:hypothetical protein